MEIKFARGLVIGRFQPFHNGHAYLIKKALEYAQTLTIGIGITAKVAEDDPLSYEIRKKMLQKFLQKEHLDDKVKTITPIFDYPSDKVWLDEVLKKVGKVDLIIGNNDWVNGIFQSINIPIQKVPYYKRFLFEGKKIRQLVKQGKSWQNRVPKYLIDTIFHYLAK